MLFTSLEFLFFFFPVTLAGNFLLPQRMRNYWLLLCSLFFYAWGEPLFVLCMLGSIALNYACALCVERVPLRRKKAVLALALAANIGMLFVCKYLGFVTATLHQLIPGTKNLFEATHLRLPIGISFFTFQAMSYVIDVYRGVPAQKNPAYLGLYISLFPQLIAGPIVRYTTVMDQIRSRTVAPQAFYEGCIRFLRGFNKKMLLANVLAQAADLAFSMEYLSAGMAWLGALCYTLQIFFDFSGYSEMAIGMGRMLGFEFLENFNYPYISKTVTEFWRRWHISLGTWFRDYVYFPLGGSRVRSKRRLVFNLAVVWLVTGVWHGASWNFILWGVLFGVVIITEKLLQIPRRIEEAGAGVRACGWFVTMLLVIFGWVLFRAENLPAAWTYMRSMLGMGGSALFDAQTMFYLREYALTMLAGVLCSAPLLLAAQEKLEKRSASAAAALRTAEHVMEFVLFWVSVSALVMDAYNPFIYFNF